jgi:hypothetical protein
MGVVNKRAGFTTLAGAANPPIIVSDVAPNSPTKKTIWVNKRTGESKYWSNSAWQPITTINQKTGLPVQTWIGSAAEYAAIVTKDDDTLYFVYA